MKELIGSSQLRLLQICSGRCRALFLNFGWKGEEGREGRGCKGQLFKFNLRIKHEQKRLSFAVYRVHYTSFGRRADQIQIPRFYIFDCQTVKLFPGIVVPEVTFGTIYVKL